MMSGRVPKRRGRPRKNPRDKRYINDTPTDGSTDIDIIYEKIEKSIKTENGPNHTNLENLKEVRIVLEDLKYGDLLTQQQRRELTPKRHRTSSNVSDRTKECLKQVMKEESRKVFWLSSSLESLTDLVYLNQSTPRRADKSRNSRKRSRKDHRVTEIKKDHQVIEIKNDHEVEDNKKTIKKESENHDRRKRSHGRRRSDKKARKSSHDKPRSSLQMKEKSSIEDSTGRLKDENNSLAHNNKHTKYQTPKIVGNYSKSNYLIERLLNNENSNDTTELVVDNKKRKQDDLFPDCSKRVKTESSSPEKLNSCKSTPETSNPCFDRLNNELESMTNEYSIKTDKTAPLTVTPEKSVSHIVTNVPLGNDNTHIDLRDNELSSYINDTKPEDFGIFHTLLPPLDKEFVSLDSIEEAIDNDLAAGNLLMPISQIKDENKEGDLSSPTDVMPIELKEHQYASKPPRNQGIEQAEWEICGANESPNAFVSANDSSLLSSGSVTSLGSGKRKLPEIIKDDVLPKGTIEVSLIKTKLRKILPKTEGQTSSIPKNEQNGEKERISQNSSNQTQLQKNSPSTVVKSSDDKLSGAFKTWTALPEIAVFLEQDANPVDKDLLVSNWDDSLNNNQFNNFNRKDNSGANDLSPRKASSRSSNVSDEIKAMTNLLSTFDEDEDPSKSTPLRKKVIASVPLLPNIQNKKSQNKNYLLKIDVMKRNPVVKLTVQNLDRFNALCPNNFTGKENLSTDSSNLLTDVSKQEREKQRIMNSVKQNSVEEDVDSEYRETTGKMKLIRKHWKNGENWTAEPVGNLSPSQRSLGSPGSLKIDEGSIDGSIGENEEGAVTTEKNDVINNNNDVINDITGKIVDSNVCFQKRSSPRENLQNEGSNAHREIPSFGEPSIYNAVEKTSGSSRASSSSSPSSSSSSSSSSEDSDSDSEQCDSTVEVSNRVEETLEFNKETKSGDTLADASAIQEMETEIATIESPSPERIADEQSNDVGLNEKLKDLVSELGINEGDSNMGSTETLSALDNDKMENSLDELRTTLEASEEKTCHVEKPSKAASTAGSTDEDEDVLNVDDELDCLSLFTESLSGSRCGSPTATESVQRADKSNSALYARMTSANLGKYLAENNREFEADMRACQDNSAESPTWFEDPSIHDKAVNASLENEENHTDAGIKAVAGTKPDLRETLNIRAQQRDAPSLFKGQCFSWLRNGGCPNANECRFRHALKPILVEFKFDQNTIDELVNHAINCRYFHFIELIQIKVTENMTPPQIILMYKRLYSHRLISPKIIENIIDTLKARGVSYQDILYSVLQDVFETDAIVKRCILLAMYKKMEKGFCWDVLGTLLSQVDPVPIPIIETVMEETLEKNCRIQAGSVYENLIQKMPYYMTTRIRAQLWTQFQRLKDGILEALHIDMDPESNASQTIISPESPQLEKTIEEPAYLSRRDINFSERGSDVPSLFPSRPGGGSEIQSQSQSSTDSRWNLSIIDDLPSPKGPYRDSLWKFHWDLQGIQEGLKYKDYNHVLRVLQQYTAEPDRLPHIEGFYKILCNEITSAKHHLSELIRLTVQCGSSDALRLYMYDLGVQILAKLTDIGAWLHAYELLKILNVFGSYNTCAFTLLAAEIYIANRRPSKALELLERSRLIHANTRRWREIFRPNDMALRVTVIDSLLYSLSDGHTVEAFRLLEFILNDQCNTFKPINLVPHINRIARSLISEKRTNLVVELGRLVFQRTISVNSTIFRELINFIFHEDRLLSRQLHRYATWLGIYNKAKMNAASYVHIMMNLNWTEEEMFLVISSLLDDLYMNIGYAIGRLRVRELNVFLIFESIPSDRQLESDTCSEPISNAVIKKHRATIKSILDRFDPKIKLIQRLNGRVCKLQSASLVYYLKSGQLRI